MEYLRVERGNAAISVIATGGGAGRVRCGRCAAALAQIHKLRLATRNTRDFPVEKFAFVTVPYQSGTVRL